MSRYIAVEMAGILHTLGSDTTLCIRYDTPLRSFDTMVQETLVEEMNNSGLKLCMYMCILHIYEYVWVCVYVSV